MKKYFTIMLSTAIAYLTLTPVAYAAIVFTSPKDQSSNYVSEPAALLVSLTALGLFIATRRRRAA